MRFDDFLDLWTFVKGDVVEDHHIMRCQRWRKLGFNVDREDFGIHWRMNQPGSSQAVVAQTCNKRLGLHAPNGACVR